jgi:hypothetical protein
VNAELVRGLIRMGFYVGVHTEHGHDVDRLDDIVDALAAPVLAAMGDEVSEARAYNSVESAYNPCQSVSVVHGQCVMGGDPHAEHGTRDGDGKWHSWVQSNDA